MKRIKDYETLSGAMNRLTSIGYTESFKAKKNNIEALYSKKTYQPSDLVIEETFRFEGMTNPADQTELFAISANDGTKGTLAMSYNAQQSQNIELIKQIIER